MAQITVTTGTLKSKASELQASNRQLNTQIDQLQQQESSLCGMWEGEAKNAFDKAFHSDIQQMQNFHQAIEEYVTKLNEIINAYEQAEAKNTQLAGQRTYK